ncbi:hypothetical protein FRC03_011411 [Tulasnella sp. 419]|nr:hypothetical protein FRC02_001767 [Tulasnella sp. 418]KAG8954772.1 hypothetical protein FRC03_011411 [Tulasnella sp. 419]
MADSSYDIRPGGSLKLKKSGDEGKKKKKSSKSKEKEKEQLKAKMLEEQKKADAAGGESSARNSPMPGLSTEGGGSRDNRTEAERRFDEIQRQRRAERVAKMASMTHKDRVQDFNKKLEELSEHHDIPRVGPG